MKQKDQIQWDHFQQVELRVGTIMQVKEFPEARKASYRLWIDFGPEIGIKKTSAQLKTAYTKEELRGKQIIGVVNFPPKQIANFISEFLITGFVQEDGKVVLAVPDKKVKNGLKLS